MAFFVVVTVTDPLDVYVIATMFTYLKQNESVVFRSEDRLRFENWRRMKHGMQEDVTRKMRNFNELYDTRFHYSYGVNPDFAIPISERMMYVRR